MGLIPPPFEQCLKKLHNWYGMASLSAMQQNDLKSNTTWSHIGKVETFITRFPGCNNFVTTYGLLCGQWLRYPAEPPFSVHTLPFRREVQIHFSFDKLLHVYLVTNSYKTNTNTQISIHIHKYKKTRLEKCFDKRGVVCCFVFICDVH